MKRRNFFRTVRNALGGAAGYLLASRITKASPAGSGVVRVAETVPRHLTAIDQHRFKLGMYLGELQLPFDESLAKAKEIGVESVWVSRGRTAYRLHQEKTIEHLSDVEVDQMAHRVQQQGLEIFLLSAGSTFKHIHLTDLKKDKLTSHEGFQKDFGELVRCMEIASRIGVGAVGSFTFAWPGEYKADKPTWPMRWLTRGGYIADVDMEKLVVAFRMVAEEAERHNVDVALFMMPWNYTNTTGNFRRVIEAVGSTRLKVMWGPADNYNSGEWDVATAGFNNIRPYLHGLHLKDIHVIDGLKRKFEYRSLGNGDVNYLEILRRLEKSRSDAVLSLATHFIPPGGTREEAMRINFSNLQKLIHQVQSPEHVVRQEAGA